MNVGEYARLNNTLYNTVVILKIMEVFDNTILTENDGSLFQGEYGIDEIINHSYNIIDLIEVGDYVNDEKIVGIGLLTNGPEKGTKTIDYYIAPNTLYYFKNEDIKSIVTHEQMEAMQYRVEE